MSSALIGTDEAKISVAKTRNRMAGLRSGDLTLEISGFINASDDVGRLVERGWPRE